MFGISRQKMRWHHAGGWLCWALFLAGCQGGGAQECEIRKDNNNKYIEPVLWANKASYTRFNGSSLPSGFCDTWMLSDLNARSACEQEPTSGEKQYMSFEFWRSSAATPQMLADDVVFNDVYFLVTKGVNPATVAVSPSSYSLNPPRADALQGNAGTWQDENGDMYQRAYHRVVVPLENKGQGTNWYITVANLNSKTPAPITLELYYVRVTCVAESLPNLCPDPKPQPGLGPNSSCSGQGICSMPDAGTPMPALNRVCTCNNGYGDYGCNREVLPLTPSDTSQPPAASSSIAFGKWAFFQFQVPAAIRLGAGTQSGSTQPTLLIEMRKAAVGINSGVGGDPVLMVKPNTGDHSVPWFGDARKYGDMRNFYLLQNYHYIIFRSLPTNVTSFYVAVYNNDRRYAALLGSNTRAEVQLSVRFRGRTGEYKQGLCPMNCNSRGTCYDPWDDRYASDAPPSIFATPGQRSVADFMCACNPGFGGSLCEGSVRDVRLNGDNTLDSVQPGDVDYYLLRPTPANFRFASDVISIDWRVTSPAVQGTTLNNIFMTIDENAYPRDAQFDTMEYNRRGWQLFYNVLAARADPPALQIRGSELRPNVVLVVGIYNSDYTRNLPISYQLNVGVPQGGSSSWMHPYMSVVLGVTAAIILCLLLTLTKRFLQRRGIGPWRNQRLAIQGGQGTPVISIAPRQAGVPAHIVTGFHSYQYCATKAQRCDLHRSQREHESVQAQLRISNNGAGDGTNSNNNSSHQGQQQEAQPPGTPDSEPQVMNRPMGQLGVRPGSAKRSPSMSASGMQVQGAASQASLRTVPEGFVSPTMGDAASGGTAAGGAVAGAGAASAAAVVTGAQENATTIVVMPSGVAAATGASLGPYQPDLATTSAPLHFQDDDDEEPQCTVCLCEYEEGESITELPCKHGFHTLCINKWMQSHNTCPICRISLVPEDAGIGHDHDASYEGFSNPNNRTRGGQGGIMMVPMGSTGVSGTAGAAGGAAAAIAAGRQGSARRGGFLVRFLPEAHSAHPTAQVAAGAAVAHAHAPGSGVQAGSANAANGPVSVVVMGGAGAQLPVQGAASVPSSAASATAAAIPGLGVSSAFVQSTTLTIRSHSGSFSQGQTGQAHAHGHGTAPVPTESALSPRVQSPTVSTGGHLAPRALAPVAPEPLMLPGPEAHAPAVVLQNQQPASPTHAFAEAAFAPTPAAGTAAAGAVENGGVDGSRPASSC